METSQTQQSFFAFYDWYRTMRATQPVFYDEQHRSWHVFRYDDVAHVLKDYAAFSSDIQATLNLQGEKVSHSNIIFMDPPRHHQIRGLVSQVFTPRVVAQLESRIQEVVRELLARLPDNVDLVRDLAVPLPVMVIAELLGIPADKRADFKRWSDAALALSGPPSLYEQNERWPLLAQEREQLYVYLQQIIEERREKPRQDLISRLVVAEVEGERLTPTELLAFCELLLVAGNETTTHLIGNSVISLHQHPDALEQLRHHPELIPDAIEEVLRYLSPVKAMARFTRNKVTLGGQRIPAGQMVTAWISSANRDEKQFAEPDRFDIQRHPNRHIAFGNGIHFCLGAPLARLEGRIALTAMLDRFPGRWHVPVSLLEHAEGMIIFGAKQIPLTWED